MRKYSGVLIAVLMIAALAVTGCGGGDSGDGKLSAQEILDLSSEAMKDITSIKAVGEYRVKADIAEEEEMDISLEMEIDITNPDKPVGKMIMSGMGEELEMFFSDGYVYLNAPDEGWIKAHAAESQTFQAATPGEIVRFSDGAENLKIASEDSGSYEISFDISDKYFMEQADMDEDLSELGPEMEKMIQDMLKGINMSAMFRIAKDTYHVENADILIEMKDMPMMGSMSLEMTLGFSNFNVPIAVVLPPEAAGAVEVDDLDDTIPSLPSLGF